MPDCRPKGLAEQIKDKCIVLNFPIVYPSRLYKEAETASKVRKSVLPVFKPLENQKLNKDSDN